MLLGISSSLKYVVYDIIVSAKITQNIVQLQGFFLLTEYIVFRIITYMRTFIISYYRARTRRDCKVIAY